MEHNIIEMSSVNISGWDKYESCNAPGCTGRHVCPASRTDYCCSSSASEPIANHTSTQLPGRTRGHGWPWPWGTGYWYSFPRESRGVTWNETLIRRVEAKCVGNAWRKDAGGCSDCGEILDSCVADCIKKNLFV